MDNVIIALQGQVRKFTMELEHIKASERRGPYHRELDVNTIDISIHLLMKIMKIGVLEEDSA